MNKKIIIIIIAVVLVAGVAAAILLMQPREIKQFYYSPGDAFVTNVLDSDRLIKTTLVICTNGDQETLISEKNAVIRDTLLQVFRETPEEQYKSANLQTYLSDIRVARLNGLFPPEEGGENAVPRFARIYFNDFVMQ